MIFAFDFDSQTLILHARIDKTECQEFKNLFILSRNLFEETPRATNKTCGSWQRQLLLQGQNEL